MKYTTRPCFYCNATSTVEVDEVAFKKWQEGAYVQDAFPDWSPDQRELLITGTHPACWDQMLGEEL